MEPAVHRVSLHTETKLRERVELLRERSELSDEYEKYLAENALVKKNKQAKCTTYESLGVVLSALNMSYGEFLRYVNIMPECPVAWGNDVEARMASMVDSLNVKQQENLTNVFIGLLPTKLKEGLDEAAHITDPGRRITFILDIGYNEDNNCLKMFSELGIASKWKQKIRTTVAPTAVPHEYIPALVNRTGISPHWMLNCDASVLCRTEAAEKVMDLFCFLPKDIQIVLEQGLTTAIKSGGVLID